MTVRDCKPRHPRGGTNVLIDDHMCPSGSGGVADPDEAIIAELVCLVLPGSGTCSGDSGRAASGSYATPASVLFGSVHIHT